MANNEARPGYYKNPILHADYSDPDIIHVGDDFYMVSSSFNHFPALPVLHSRDLVNWKIINHVFSAFNDKTYDTMQPGKGVWAPSIRYHDGKFWVFFSTPDEGIFMSFTDDPRSKWSTPHCVKTAKGWIDPCPLWDDDGRAWLVHAFAHSRSGRKHQLQLIEMSPDGCSLLSEGKIIYDGALDQPTLEGPKFYKRNGWYYIFAPAGGVETGWQSVLRARKLSGPWEARVVLQQGQTSINGPHQGGFVELENGECWFIHFQDADLYGRIVHLQPMRWQSDDWPLVGEKHTLNGPGQPVKEHLLPSVAQYPQGSQAPQTSDDFANGKPGLQWQWQAHPQEKWLNPTKDALSLACQIMPEYQGEQALYAQPNLLLQKFPAREFSATTELHAQFQHADELSGLIIYGERYAALVLEQRKGQRKIVLISAWMSDTGILHQQQRDIADWPSNTPLWLRVNVASGGICHFSYGENNIDWHPVSPCFAAGKGKWVGAKLGIFAASRQAVEQPGNGVYSHFKIEL
ncbi:glycoside hydrolase 43 family protein [Buttiauxella noackiae]|uniref:glycoside hydrolase family 43 protein n=1 Tax=Buttiauxella noackiae TaxID=82992 RepID=UPI002353270A|nr:glycoside hydrolase 43 family protein [Buttiauxella noackiae]MCA1922975.1 glycoside hydrolase 43 family protein [Buttiauxella noackiae]